LTAKKSAHHKKCALKAQAERDSWPIRKRNQCQVFC